MSGQLREGAKRHKGITGLRVCTKGQGWDTGVGASRLLSGRLPRAQGYPASVPVLWSLIPSLCPGLWPCRL